MSSERGVWPKMTPMIAAEHAKARAELATQQRSDRGILLAIEDRMTRLEKKLNKLLDQSE